MLASHILGVNPDHSVISLIKQKLSAFLRVFDSFINKICYLNGRCSHLVLCRGLAMTLVSR